MVFLGEIRTANELPNGSQSVERDQSRFSRTAPVGRLKWLGCTLYSNRMESVASAGTS